MKQITDLRKDVSWINDAPADSLYNVIERLDGAYKSFFKGGGHADINAAKNIKRQGMALYRKREVLACA